MSWESVSVAPVRTPEGYVTVPEEVIHSMEKNRIGLKGVCVCVCERACVRACVHVCVVGLREV